MKYTLEQAEARTAYTQRTCETDAAWKLYCRVPTKGTWNLYIQALDDETKAGLALEGFGLKLCDCGAVTFMTEEKCEDCKKGENNVAT